MDMSKLGIYRIPATVDKYLALLSYPPSLPTISSQINKVDIIYWQI